MPRTKAEPREPRFASLPVGAAYAGVPVRTLRSWITRGLVPGYRIGPRLIQVDLNDIDDLRRRIPAGRGVPSGSAVGQAS